MKFKFKYHPDHSNIPIKSALEVRLKISILAFSLYFIQAHKNPYLDTSMLVHFSPVARYPKENRSKSLLFSFG